MAFREKRNCVNTYVLSCCFQIYLYDLLDHAINALIVSFVTTCTVDATLERRKKNNNKTKRERENMQTKNKTAKLKLQQTEQQIQTNVTEK